VFRKSCKTFGKVLNFLFRKNKVRLILSFCHLLVFEKGGQVSEGKVRAVHQHNELSEILSDEFLLEVE